MNRQRWMPLLFCGLLPMLPLWRTLAFAQTIGPFDQIRQMAPWNGPKPGYPWDVLQIDGVLQFFPWRDLVLSAWSKGQIPLWNNYELAGTPLLPNSQSGALYPPHILLGLLHVPTAVAIVLLMWLHLATAGLGAYALSRSFGASRAGGLVAAASFALCPFLLSWAALASVATTVCWIPWIFWAISDLFSNSSRQSRHRLLILALATAMMLLGGHLQFAFYGLLGAAIYAVVAALSNRSLKPLGLTIAGIVLGIAISSAQLLPVTQFGKLSNRQNTPTEEGYTAYLKLAIQPFELGTMANPKALGDPRDSLADSDPQTTSLPPTSTYWPPFLKSGGNFAESAICIGPIVLALLGLASWKDRRIWPVAVVGLVMFLLCTGTILNKFLYFYMPGWSATGSPGRCVVLFILAACTIAGSAIRVELPSSSKKIWIAPAALLLLGILLSLYAPTLAPAAPPKMEKLIEVLQAGATSGALLGLLIVVALGGGAIALTTLPRFSAFRRFAPAIPILFCALCYGTSLVSTGKPLDTVAAPTGTARVAYVNHEWSLFDAPHATMPPNTASLSRVHELGGYDSLMSGQTVEMLTQVNGGNPAPNENGNMMFVKTEDPKALASAGVSFIETGTGLTPIADAPGRVSLTNGKAEIVAEDFSSLTIAADGNGQLTVRDRMMPGWSAEVDGKPVAVPDGIWRVVSIDGPGHHQVRFSYSPSGFKTGVIVSLISILATLAVALVPLRRQRSNPEPIS